MSTPLTQETVNAERSSPSFRLFALSALIGGLLGGGITLIGVSLLNPLPLKLGSVNNKSIFAEQARRLADIKAQSPQSQAKALEETILSYSKAVREISKDHNVILLDQSAVATDVPSYTKYVEEKLFGHKQEGGK